MPAFISIVLFIFYFFLMKEHFSKIISINSNLTSINKNVKFFTEKYYGDYYYLIKFIYKFTIYVYILFFLNNCYFFSYSNITYYFSFHLYNYVWLYYLILNIVIIISLLLLFNYFLSNITKSFEFLISIIFFFNCLFYYLLVNNLIALIFIFELQSLVFIYLLATNFSLNINYNNLYTMRYNNFTVQPI